ncbi:MAG: NADH-quinone oxidoreductase subunit NuoH [Thermodesulfobacteriota bacterium]
MEEFLRIITYIVCISAFVGANLAWLGWVERKGAGRLQRRTALKEVGPFGLLQPLADGLKLMSKQLHVPRDADRPLYMLAPVIAMVPMIMTFVVIPFNEGLVPRDFNMGLLVIFAFAALSVLALLLGGWASRNKYALISASRAVSQNIAYEIPMLLTAITVVMATGTMNLTEIVNQQAGTIIKWNFLRLDNSILMPVSFLIFFVCSVAETNRAPFDLGEAESELIAGFHTEYSGMGFGLFMMAEYGYILIGCCFTTILFLGGWHCPFGFYPGIHWFLIKTYFLIWVIVWIRWTFPRVTVWGLLNLSWMYLIPAALFNLILTGAFLKVF